MPSSSSSSASDHVRRTSLTVLASVAAGALAGAIAGWSIAPISPDQGGGGYVSQPTEPTPPTTSTPAEPGSNGIVVIPVERTPQTVLLPAPFAERRSSPVAGVYRRGAAASGGLLTEDRLLGQAVAVTSDGWFVAPASLMTGVRIADAVLWHDGHAATATRAILDQVSGVVFLKTPFTGLDAPSFARAGSVTPGLAVWIERRSDRFEASGITALFELASSLDGASSETAIRRGIASGVMNAGDVGAPVWSANGALIGLVSAAPEAAVTYIPVSAWSASLSSLLSNNEIRHASLGVRSVELGWTRLDGSVRVSAERGAWVREDAKQKRPAIVSGSPAAIAGVKAGDVITQVDRDILDGSVDLGELLANYRPGSNVTLTVQRGAQSLDIPVQLGSIVTSEILK
jgi:S1-C subfamily serine protease